MSNALDLLDAAIIDLEARLNLAPGGSIPVSDSKSAPTKKTDAKQVKKKEKKQKKPQQAQKEKNAPANHNQPEICKLEFKVGQITKVWVHPDADKLYCEEIECGEEKPRQIASGLRPHYSLEEMERKFLLLKAAVG